MWASAEYIDSASTELSTDQSPEQVQVLWFGRIVTIFVCALIQDIGSLSMFSVGPHMI